MKGAAETGHCRRRPLRLDDKPATGPEVAGSTPTEPVRAVLETEAFGRVEVIVRDCPLCGASHDQRPVDRYRASVWAMRRCGGCGFVYLRHAPDYRLLHTDMAWEKTTRIEETRRAAARPLSYGLSKRTRWRFKLLPRKTMPGLLAAYARPGNVVDLGCGDGGQLAGLDSAFVPYGVEISADLAAKASQAFRAQGGDAVNAPSSEGLRRFPEGYFTAATLRSYLEHELDPTTVLQEVHRTLAPGGVALVKVPNFSCLNRTVMGARWPGFRFPDHLNYFTPATLRAMARRTGFTVSYGLTHRLPTSDNMYAVLRRA